jgi:general stress protein YciG
VSGTPEGGRTTAKTNKERHGADFYVRIGRKGGRNSRGGGFASESIGSDGLTGRERASLAGKRGGRMSRRGPAKREEA